MRWLVVPERSLIPGIVYLFFIVILFVSVVHVHITCLILLWRTCYCQPVGKVLGLVCHLFVNLCNYLLISAFVSVELRHSSMFRFVCSIACLPMDVFLTASANLALLLPASVEDGFL